MGLKGLLGGSGVVTSGVVSPLIWVISIVTLLISLLIITHEPPSRGLGLKALGCEAQAKHQALEQHDPNPKLRNPQ